MVIHPNSQTLAKSAVLNAGGGNGNKLPPSGVAESASPTVSEDTAEIATASRGSAEASGASESMIFDEQFAREATQFARFHMLSKPSSAMLVQANSSPEAVFELLQGILA